MTKTLRMRQDEIHQSAVAHGWWEGKGSYDSRIESIPEKLLLIHSEVSEACEEYRNGNIETYYTKYNKPEGVFVELADVVIRILDLAGACGVDLERLIEEKHNYNLTRTYRHGNKKI